MVHFFVPLTPPQRQRQSWIYDHFFRTAVFGSLTHKTFIPSQNNNASSYSITIIIIIIIIIFVLRICDRRNNHQIRSECEKMMLQFPELVMMKTRRWCLRMYMLPVILHP
ncbi:hypothetical protein CFP56_037248 [Quercus suber]|uniref:Uncharacterized protein n=1 Tax=Quercus suber TaxID=58331 RepID=A0AAW0J5D1_QUESU